MSRILLIEDNRDYAATLATNLEREGYDVAIASTGTAGLAEAKHYQPDLIVLDLMLPAMNGYSVLQRLRDEGRETPVLIMTARGTEEEKLRGFDLGADDYIVKPCGLREFLARVKALLKRSTGAAEAARVTARSASSTSISRRASCDAGPRRCRFAPRSSISSPRSSGIAAGWSRAPSCCARCGAMPTGTRSRTVETHLAALARSSRGRPARAAVRRDGSRRRLPSGRRTRRTADRAVVLIAF